MGICCLLLSPWCLWLLACLILYYVYVSLFTPIYRRSPLRAPFSVRAPHTRGTGQLMKCVAPATGAQLAPIHAYTRNDVLSAYKNAAAAQKAWGQSSFEERRAVLQEIVDWIVDNQEAIIQKSVDDSGKTITEASLGEVMITCEKLRWIMNHGQKHLKRESRPVPLLLRFTKKAYIDYHPLGVIGVIVPWNYPFHNVFSAVGAALFSGNGAVVKVSEFASSSAGWIEDIFRRVLTNRGWNPDLVQVITGYAETGQALVESGVDKILFIGSPSVGKLVMRAASASLTPVILELGGKDPFIVFDDCDFNQMIDIAVRGAFINCGQNCISAERFYVQAGVYDKFVSEVVKRVKQLEQGETHVCENKRCDFGAITMPAQLNIVESLVSDAVSSGAKLLHGGRRFQSPSAPEGLFYTPTILANVTQKMRIANEEVFGPVMTIIKFESEQQVIEMANSTDYGLGSSVFTTDYTKADRVASQLVTGMTSVNDFGMVPMVQSLPFGGVKHSGFGAFNGAEGLRGFSRAQAVVTDRFGIRAQTPPFLQYPVAHNAFKIVQAGVRMVYGKSWIQSIKGFVEMMKLIMKSKK